MMDYLSMRKSAQGEHTCDFNKVCTEEKREDENFSKIGEEETMKPLAKESQRIHQLPMRTMR